MTGVEHRHSFAVTVEMAHATDRQLEKIDWAVSILREAGAEVRGWADDSEG